jgi:hypothetical protein|tara:strand:- start:253 stop:1041 length:789 start_codon:yes stop_codon:yes gene_type:complete
MNKKIENKFFETTDYTRFKKTRGNRPVDPTHVLQLKKLIAEKDLYDPIRVNKNMEVIDGQHTLEARKQLDLKIPYIIMDSDDILDVARLNTGRKNWSMNDYLNQHCARNKMDYKICRNKMAQYGINVAEAVVLLLKQASLWSRISQDFKTGQFIIPAGGIEHCDKIGGRLMQLKKYFYGMESEKNKRFKRSMVCSYIVAHRHPKFEHSRFLKACKTRSSWFLTGTSTADYVAIIERIYNAGLTPKNKINLVEFYKSKEYLEI